MRAACSPTEEVGFHPARPNLLIVQESCLGDWERMMEHGPSLFRNWAVLMCPYDGFTKAEEASIVYMPVWLQIHKLLDGIGRKISWINC